ncbi:MAG: biopolymer transporter ExbD [Bacteroidales bacterium]|nr:biopolymer transporter ExbD [Bacteroidales bacterium]
MAKRSTPGLNTSSMADISFLLLTFFLMTSSINTDMGIGRRLPPPLDKNAEVPEVHKRNVLKVSINYNDALSCNYEWTDIRDLKQRTKEFLSNPNNDPSLPEKVDVEIEGLGTYPVSQGVISLLNDRGTSYDMYFRVQNELAAAINELRDELAMERFHKHYADLKEAQTEAINKAIPVPISEAEPKNIGGTK